MVYSEELFQNKLQYKRQRKKKFSSPFKKKSEDFTCVKNLCPKNMSLSQ